MADTTALDKLPVTSNGKHDWTTSGSKEFMQAVKDNLAKVGLPRTSTLNGGAITGYTTHSGSTGYSVAFLRPEYAKMYEVSQERQLLNFHVVVSGEAAGLKYEPDYSWDDDADYDDEPEYHKPVNPELLEPKIKAVFESMGIKVILVKVSGWQTHWDDDIEYTVLAEIA